MHRTAGGKTKAFQEAAEGGEPGVDLGVRKPWRETAEAPWEQQQLKK